MAGLVNAARNGMLDYFGAQARFVSLHTADPGTSGTAEVTGGLPAYSRKAITWTTASSSTITSGSTVTFDVPGGVTITHLGYWSASTGGVFYGSRPFDTAQVFATQGTYTLSPGTITEALT